MYGRVGVWPGGRLEKLKLRLTELGKANLFELRLAIIVNHPYIQSCALNGKQSISTMTVSLNFYYQTVLITSNWSFYVDTILCFIRQLNWDYTIHCNYFIL